MTTYRKYPFNVSVPIVTEEMRWWLRKEIGPVYDKWSFTSMENYYSSEDFADELHFKYAEDRTLFILRWSGHGQPITVLS